MQDMFIKERKKTMGKYRYVTDFDLDGVPEDWEGAYHYLEEDDMLKYYDGPGKEKLKCIDWCLTSSWQYSSGFILVDTYEELTEEESSAISRYIRGQNSDGLGEGFEQTFYYLSDYETDDDGNPVEKMCCFDWYENEYKLHRYGTHYRKSDWVNVDRFAGVWEETDGE